MIAYDEDGLRLYLGEALASVRELADESVDCVVTSPPYFGLRDYGTATWIGGDPNCEHKENTAKRKVGKTSHRAGRAKAQNHVPQARCPCKATRVDDALGHEATPTEYVARLVELFAEIRRVLKPAGTVWLNLGDSYSGSGRGMNADGSAGKTGEKQATNKGANLDKHDSLVESGAIGRYWVKPPEGYKPKDLIPIAWLVGLALQQDGWWLRADNIWNKPNAMPESVQDRPTKSHEYVLLLSKSQRYFYDAYAVREPYNEASLSRYKYEFGHGDAAAAAGSPSVGDGTGHTATPNPGGRTLRTVWTFPTEPSPLPHFAAFPEELARRCILAGASEGGCCAECGAPLKRVIEVSGETPRERLNARGKAPAAAAHKNPQGLNHSGAHVAPERVIVPKGWERTCKHEGGAVPAVVLDPFAGTGTTLKVARDLGRHAVGIDLSPRYVELAINRLRYGVQGAKQIEGGTKDGRDFKQPALL